MKLRKLVSMLGLAFAAAGAFAASPYAGQESREIKALVEKERDLDQLFASKAITAEHLGSALEEIGVPQARVREAHLEAHLAQVAILTPEQNARYGELRGYGAANLHRGHEHQR